MRKSILLSIVLVISLSFSVVLFRPIIAESVNTSGGVVVRSIQGPTLHQQIVERAKNSWSWYVVRGSGIIAAIALVILMLSGIGLVTGHTFRFLEPITAWASHRALCIVFGVSIVLHMTGLLFDHFVSFNLLNILVPWLSDYKPVTIFGVQLGSLFVALGVLAFYLAIVVVVSSLLWVEKKQRIWKLIHILSYLVMAFVFVHAIYLGTDLANGVFRWIWIIVGIIIAVVSGYRLRRSRSI